jgi:hypothetical protein
MPSALASAEGFFAAARQSFNERHLLRVLTAYTTFYNERRPHQGLDQCCPVPLTSGAGAGPLRCRDVLGGILHDYHREAA